MLTIVMPEGQAQWLWRLGNQQWHQASHLEQLLQESRTVYSGQDVTVYFPTQHAQYLTKPLSRQQFKKLGTQGVHYLIEDISIDSVDHLAIFYHHQAEDVHLMAIAQSLRAAYQNSLALLPWTVRALLPDFLLLPVPKAGELIVAQIYDRRLLRWSAWRGWIWEQLDYIGFLDVDMAQSSEQRSIEIVHFYGVDDTLQQQVIAQLTQHAVQDVTQDITEDTTESAHETTPMGITWQAFATLPEPVLNLRHPFNILIKKSSDNQRNPYWTACLVMLLLAVTTQSVYDAVRWWHYKKLANQTAELAVNQYKIWFPEESRVNEQNLRSKFKAKLQANAAADKHALELISKMGAVMQQMNLSAQQVNYQNSELSMDVLASNPTVLNQLASQLKQQGLSVSIGSIQNQGARIIGTIKVQ